MSDPGELGLEFERPSNQSGQADGRAALDQAEKRSQMNGLDVRSWMRFTKSWFVCNPPPRSQSKLTHPAKYPEEMVRGFVEFFTKPGETVLDPFAGVGSTVVAASSVGRLGVGIELSEHFYQTSVQGLNLLPDSEVYIHGDARDAVRLCAERGVDGVDYIITSPPYWNMLEQSRGGVLSAQRIRAEKGLNTVYSDNERDLGNVSDYSEFLDMLTEIIAGTKNLLRSGRYLTIVIQNVRVPGGEVKPLAWDLTTKLAEHFTFKGERIWLQDNKKLGCWGWPSEFVTNVHHHYCLIFKNDKM